MKGFLLMCSAALILLTVADLSYGEKSCKEIMSDFTKRQMGGIASCSKSMTFKNGKDKAAKMNCVLKCVLIKEGVLDAEGRMPTANFEAFVAKEFPESLHGTVVPIFRKCQAETAAGLDPSEEFCKSYDPLIKCLLAAIGGMCK